MSNIERADKIVGRPNTGGFSDQRCAYLDWIVAQPRADVEPHLHLGSSSLGIGGFRLDTLADIICAIDDARKPKGDGLPPGPWRADKTNTYEFVHDTAGCTVAVAPKFGDFNHTFGPAIAAYIARCGSQPVRDILAACDDAELARWAKLICKWKLPDFDIENVESLARVTVMFLPR